MPRPVSLHKAGERLLEQRLRFARQAEPPIDFADRTQERCTRFRMVRELDIDTLRTPIQQLASRYFTASRLVGIGQLEEVHKESRHLLCSSAFPCRSRHLDRHRNREARCEHDGCSNDAHAEHMPRDELARAICPAVACGEHGPSCEISLDVA
jgi:hypothetical protein